MVSCIEGSELLQGRNYLGRKKQLNQVGLKKKKIWLNELIHACYLSINLICHHNHIMSVLTWRFLRNGPSLVSKLNIFHLTLQLNSFLSSLLLLCAPGGWPVWTPSTGSHTFWFEVGFSQWGPWAELCRRKENMWCECYSLLTCSIILDLVGVDRKGHSCLSFLYMASFSRLWNLFLSFAVSGLGEGRLILFSPSILVPAPSCIFSLYSASALADDSLINCSFSYSVFMCHLL